jgi:hypothetical protein
MRLITAVVLSGLVGIACQKKSAEEDNFQSTKLSVGVEEIDSSLGLTQYSGASSGFVTKADLWCNDKLKANLDFSAEEQSIDLYSSLENCELRLTEFDYGGKFKVGSLFTPGVYEFELRDPANNRLLDKKLVRSIQPIVVESKSKCSDDCEFKEIHVKFPHSVLDIKKEILVNDINVNELYAHLEKENAPSCESLKARFIESGDLITPPSLEIVLKNCSNTIGTSDLEFGFGPVLLNEQGNLPSPVNITAVMDGVENFPIVPTRNGNDYTISLSFEQLQDLFKNTSFSTTEILMFDFAVIVRNKQGISGLVYLIDNQCKVKGTKI